jgi:hypothetical protein
MTFIESAAKTAVELAFAHTGVAATLRPQQDTYDPYLMSRTSDSTTATIRITPPAAFKSFESDGTSIRVGDVRFLIDPVGLEVAPKEDMLVDITVVGPGGTSTETYNIVMIQRITAGTEVLAYKVQARK